MALAGGLPFLKFRGALFPAEIVQRWVTEIADGPQREYCAYITVRNPASCAPKKYQ